jgi:hypothetical protein
VVKRGIRFAILTLLCYLLQSTVAVYLSLGGVAPNIALAVFAVVSIALGRKYTFLISVIVGYLLEVMLPSLNYINLILYPVCAMLGALTFSDKSEHKMEEARTLGKRSGNLPAHLRAPLCALLSITIFEAVNLLYLYLNGIPLDWGHYQRTLISIAYTTALASLFQYPIRWWFGLYGLKKAR